MAEAYAHILGESQVEAHSAGSRPSGVVNPKAIQAMQELGYDLSTHESKSLDRFTDMEFDFVATMGCGDACPTVQASRRADWPIPEPKDLPLHEIRDVRDLIRDKVQVTLNELGLPPNVA